MSKGYFDLPVHDEAFAAVQIFKATDVNPWLLDLRDVCRPKKNEVSIPAKVRLGTISSVVGIGALCRGDSIKRTDWGYMADALKKARALGFSVKENLEVAVLNLTTDGQGDFLRSALKADLAVSCLVYDGIRPVECSFGNKTFFYQSPDHHVEGSWNEAARKAGARMIATYGNGHQLAPQRFNSNDKSESSFHELTAANGELDSGAARGILMRKDLVASLNS